MTLELLGRIRDVGMLGLLVVALVGGWRRWYVWAWYYEQLAGELQQVRRERDEYRGIVLAYFTDTKPASPPP